MGFFERLKVNKKDETPKSGQEQLQNFEMNEELETTIREYADLGTTLIAITHDYGIDTTTEVNDPQVLKSPELQVALRKYNEAQRRIEEIERIHGDALREYLKPYTSLQDPPLSVERSPKENEIDMNRWKVARILSSK